MSVQGIHGANPTVPLASPSSLASTASEPAAASRSRVQGTAEQTTSASVDTAQDKPAPLRFPWLSRLSTQLAAASNTPTPFSAPVLGDNLDKQA